MNHNVYTWFKRRKYGGWGLCPITWQGWLLTIALTLPFIAIAPFLAPNITERNILSPSVIALISYLIFFFAFIQYIMIRIKVDERELAHEAVADRNALWTLIGVLTLGVFFELLDPRALHAISPINPFILGGLLLSWLTKMITLWRLEQID